MLSAFAHDDSLQLHFTLALLIFSFMLHSIYHPFDIHSKKALPHEWMNRYAQFKQAVPRDHMERGDNPDKYDPLLRLQKYIIKQGEDPDEYGISLIDGGKADNSSLFCCCCGAKNLQDGIILHRMERNSIIISIVLLWSAVVFILAPNCTVEFCRFLSLLCIVTLILSNFVFLICGGRSFLKMFTNNLRKNALAREMQEKRDSQWGHTAKRPSEYVNPLLAHGQKSELSSVDKGSIELKVIAKVDDDSNLKPPMKSSIEEPKKEKKGFCQYCRCFGYGGCLGCLWLAQDIGG